MDAEQLAALRDHPLVSRPHISSFNFTRDAFIGPRGTTSTTRARGLGRDLSD